MSEELASGGPGSRDEGGDDLVTRDTPVGAAWALRAEEPVVAGVADDLGEVAGRVVQCRGVGTVAVVDSEGRLVGVIPLRLLLDELFFRVSPKGFLTDILEERAMDEFGRISTARTAGDLMEPVAWVTMDDPISRAYDVMRERRLDGLPIVDAEMRPVGYLDRVHLLSVWVNAHRA